MTTLAESNTAAAPRRAPWALAGLALAVLLSALGNSIASAALPTLAQAFAAPFHDVQWVVLAYLLASTGLIVAVGRLGDIAGRRRLLLAGIALFTVASALSGAADTLWQLIAARAAQGLGAAAMIVLTMALVGGTVPKERTGSAMGVLGTLSAAGTALGPSLGGLLAAELGWQAIFLASVPPGVLAAVLVLRFVPADPAPVSGRDGGLDVAGTLLLALTLVAYALTLVPGAGGFGPRSLALLLAALAGAGLFAIVQARAKSPLIRLAAFRDPVLRAGLAGSALVSTVIMATLVVGPFYLSGGLGLAAGTVGLVVSAGPLVVALAGIPAGRMVDRVGTGPTARAGLALMAGGCLGLSLLPMSLGVPGYLGPLAAVTGGYALFQTANNTAVMAGIPQDRRGATSGLLNLSRNLGLITGASAMGAVFALASGAADIAAAPPEAVAAGMRTTFAVAAGLAAVALGLGTRRR